MWVFPLTIPEIRQSRFYYPHFNLIRLGMAVRVLAGSTWLIRYFAYRCVVSMQGNPTGQSSTPEPATAEVTGPF